MVSVDYICSLMETLGYFDFHRPDTHPLQRRLKRAFHLLQTLLLLAYVYFYLLSIITRASSYVPELIQTLNEFIMLCMIAYFSIYFASQHRKLTSLVHFMQTEFSRANEEIVRVCNARARLVFLTFLALGTLVYVGLILEVLLPASEVELDILRRVYKTKHPERRLLLKIKIPYVDETEDWAYGVLFAFEIYMGAMVVLLFTASVTFVLIVFIHFQGQCEILSSFVVQVGREHRDKDKNRIRYTSIERNEFVREACGVDETRDSLSVQRQLTKRRLRVDEQFEASVFTNPGRKLIDDSFCRVKKKVIDENNACGQYVRQWKMKTKLMKEQYELNYMRQIVKFHQKLIRFREELYCLLKPIIFQVIISNSIIFSITIYQLVLNLAHHSTFSTSRQVKLVAEFLAIGLEYFLILNCSEMSDMCNEVVRRGVVESGWDTCEPRTRRQLCLLLRRVQASNHMRLHGATNTFVLSRRFFVSVMRLAYTFVNYMNIMSVKR